MEFRNTKSGKLVAVVEPGSVTVGQQIERVLHGYANGRYVGYIDGVWQTETLRYRVTGLGSIFIERGGYIDEEDSRSLRSDGRATRIAPRKVQYAYLETI